MVSESGLVLRKARNFENVRVRLSRVFQGALHFIARIHSGKVVARNNRNLASLSAPRKQPPAKRPPTTTQHPPRPQTPKPQAKHPGGTFHPPSTAPLPKPTATSQSTELSPRPFRRKRPSTPPPPSAFAPRTCPGRISAMSIPESRKARKASGVSLRKSGTAMRGSPGRRVKPPIRIIAARAKAPTPTPRRTPSPDPARRPAPPSMSRRTSPNASTEFCRRQTRAKTKPP